jgi:serine/threonine-protein kinase
LRYSIEKTLGGLEAELKEYTIGVEALGRAPSFDPREDNIVRVQARKLRQRLDDYYSSNGLTEKCRIVFQPGSYIPRFTLVEHPARSRSTVAVLPFMNLTADDDAGYFCDGLAEELIDLLSRTKGVRVVSRTSSFQFKGTQVDIREIGKRLGADLLIEGAVRGGRPRYIATVRLLSSKDGCQLWAERYDRMLTDIVALETEIANSIASVLSSEPPPAAPWSTSRRLLYISKPDMHGTNELSSDSAGHLSCIRQRHAGTRTRQRLGPVSLSVMSC